MNKNGHAAANSWWHGEGEEIPFGIENAVEHGENAAAIEKWNTGEPYPGGNGNDIFGHKGHNGAIGENKNKNKNNHGRHVNDNNNQGNNQHGSANKQHNGHNGGGNGHNGNGGHNGRCENLFPYKDWLQATVTL
jgi:hypothetical protein